MPVNKIFERLAATASRLEKESLLKENKENEDLKLAVKLALDPLINFYIRKIPDYTANPSDDYNLNWAMSQLELLSSREVTGNDGISHLQFVLESCSEDNAKVIERIIKKDLRCGVSEATANKIWPGLVSTYPVMLCAQYEQKSVDKIKFPAFVQLKMDGMRFNAIVRNGKVDYFSRNGKALDLMGKLDEEFIQAANSYGSDVVFDGELWVSDKDGNPLPRQTGNGILAKCQKGTITEKEADIIRCTLWDMIPIADFTNGHCSISYKDRFLRLEDCIQSFIAKKLNLVISYNVYGIDEARSLFEQYLSDGQEGIILKDMNSPWEDKRVKHQIKFKGELECDLRCVGWEEGTGKNVGRLGALILESADGVIKVSVGTGFTDEMRDNLTAQQTVDKIVAIKYNAKIVDKKTGISSLFLPVFVEIREDKDIADSSNDVK